MTARFSRHSALHCLALVFLGACNGCGHPGPVGAPTSLNDGGTEPVSASASAAPAPVEPPAPPVACGDASAPPPVPVTDHPRIWITAKDLPALRARAVSSNPVYEQGVAKLATIFDGNLASPSWPLDSKHEGNTCYRCEFEMETFALMSLLAKDKAARDTWAQKSRKVLMELIKQGKMGTDPKAWNGPQSKDFSWSDRSRWAGRAFGVTVDWIYPYLSKEDKADIRTVFLRWSEELVHAQKTSRNHPEPVGIFNDKKLLENREAVRWAGNNYYVSHARNLALMAMALDPADDPDGKLHGYLDNAIGAYLYVTDELLRTDSRGGLTPEGSEYNVSTMEYLGELLYALQTAGLDDPAKRGQQASICANPFYRDMVTAYYQSLAPGPHPYDKVKFYYDFVSYGDLEVLRPFDPYFGDYIATFGPLGLAFKGRGDEALYDSARWLTINTAPGGEELLTKRMADPSVPWVGLWYFLLLDPNRPAPKDPRPAMPLDYFAPGLGFYFARTSWDKDASYFFFQNEWGSIDHRHADAMHFGLYRKGEWLTTERSGYQLSFFFSPSHNTLALENDPITTTETLPKHVVEYGSQYPYGHLSDPITYAHEATPDFAYVEGEGTARYNSDQYKSKDVLEARRAIVWLKPDTLVVYDRASTKTAGRFKRYYQLLPSAPAIKGLRAEAKTEGGQKLVFDSLLPSGATLVDDPLPKDKAAAGNGMKARLMIESKETDVRFLNVLQGMDGGGAPVAASRVKSSAGTKYDGAIVGTTAVLFKHDSNEKVGTVTFSVPSTATTILVTGLGPSVAYKVDKKTQGGSVVVTLAEGAGPSADASGVLRL